MIAYFHKPLLPSLIPQAFRRHQKCACLAMALPQSLLAPDTDGVWDAVCPHRASETRSDDELRSFLWRRSIRACLSGLCRITK